MTVEMEMEMEAEVEIKIKETKCRHNTARLSHFGYLT